eukprot:scaffold85850_cov70-Phaeocystis_antarctica.AAC.2
MVLDAFTGVAEVCASRPGMLANDKWDERDEDGHWQELPPMQLKHVLIDPRGVEGITCEGHAATLHIQVRRGAVAMAIEGLCGCWEKRLRLVATIACSMPRRAVARFAPNKRYNNKQRNRNNSTIITGLSELLRRGRDRHPASAPFVDTRCANHHKQRKAQVSSLPRSRWGGPRPAPAVAAHLSTLHRHHTFTKTRNCQLTPRSVEIR